MFFGIATIRRNTLDFSQNAVSVTLFRLINVGEFLVPQILVGREWNCKILSRN